MRLPKILIPIALIAILVGGFLIGMQPTTITCEGLDNFGVWIWNETDSNYTKDDLYYTLSLRATKNNTWESVIFQQGLLPHKWVFLGNNLKNSFTVTDDICEDALFFRVVFKLGNDWGFYTGNAAFPTYQGKNVSIIKIGVATYLWLDNDYHETNSSQLCVDILLFIAYKWNESTYISPRDMLYWRTSETDNDKHAQYYDRKLYNDSWIDITFDLGKRLRDAYEYYEIKSGSIKCVQLYAEGVNAYCDLSVSQLFYEFNPKITSNYGIKRVLAFGIVGFIISLILFLVRDHL